MIPASVGFHCPEDVADGRRTVRQPRTRYGGRVAVGRPGVVTTTLIAINVVVFVVTSLSGASLLDGSGSTSIYQHFALVPVQVAHGQYYRLLSAAFLHYGLLHIAFNMYALFVVGTPLEAVLGRWRYVTLYLLSGLGGSVLTTALGPLGEQAAGASGAIFGLFGAMYVIARHSRVATGGIAFTIVANLVLTFAAPNVIDWRGHVGGLVTGVLLALVLTRSPAGPNRTQLQLVGFAVVAALVALVGYVGVRHVDTRCPQLVTVGGGLYCSAGTPDDGTTTAAPPLPLAVR
jgi:membrane associated rhomboid family serine protease